VSSNSSQQAEQADRFPAQATPEQKLEGRRAVFIRRQLQQMEQQLQTGEGPSGIAVNAASSTEATAAAIALTIAFNPWWPWARCPCKGTTPSRMAGLSLVASFPDAGSAGLHRC